MRTRCDDEKESFLLVRTQANDSLRFNNQARCTNFFCLSTYFYTRCCSTCYMCVHVCGVGTSGLATMILFLLYIRSSLTHFHVTSPLGDLAEAQRAYRAGHHDAIRAKNEYGETCMHLACQGGSIQVSLFVWGDWVHDFGLAGMRHEWTCSNALVWPTLETKHCDGLIYQISLSSHSSFHLSPSFPFIQVFPPLFYSSLGGALVVRGRRWRRHSRTLPRR